MYYVPAHKPPFKEIRTEVDKIQGVNENVCLPHLLVIQFTKTKCKQGPLKQNPF